MHHARYSEEDCKQTSSPYDGSSRLGGLKAREGPSRLAPPNKPLRTCMPRDLESVLQFAPHLKVVDVCLAENKLRQSNSWIREVEGQLPGCLIWKPKAFYFIIEALNHTNQTIFSSPEQ